jgi:hypothetical protein
MATVCFASVFRCERIASADLDNRLDPPHASPQGSSASRVTEFRVRLLDWCEFPLPLCQFN